MFCQEKKEEVAEEKETREEKKGKEEKKDGKKVGLRDTFHAQINLSIFFNYRTSVHCESPRKKKIMQQVSTYVTKNIFLKTS